MVKNSSWPQPSFQGSWRHIFSGADVLTIIPQRWVSAFGDLKNLYIFNEQWHEFMSCQFQDAITYVIPFLHPAIVPRSLQCDIPRNVSHAITGVIKDMGIFFTENILMSVFRGKMDVHAKWREALKDCLIKRRMMKRNDAYHCNWGVATVVLSCTKNKRNFYGQ